MTTSDGTTSVTKQKMDIKTIGNTILKLISRYRTIFVFLVLVIISSSLSPHFLTIGNITNVLRQASFNGLLSIGLTLVILVKGIDLSAGSVLGVAAMTAGLLKDQPAFIIIGGALLAGALIGWVNGVTIAKLRIEPFVVTLATLTVGRGIALLMTAGYLVVGTTDTIRWLGTGYVLGIPVPVIIMALMFLIAYVVLRWTPYGRRMYAVGANEEAARLAGINVDNHKISAYVISGVMAAMAGVILVGRLNVSDPLAGTGYELDAIAATVIGGTTFDGGKGGIAGTIIGVLILAMLNNIMNLLGFSPYMQQVVKGLVLAGAVIMNEYKRRK